MIPSSLKHLKYVALDDKFIPNNAYACEAVDKEKIKRIEFV